jgi:hypothetical protein
VLDDGELATVADDIAQNASIGPIILTPDGHRDR